PEKGIHLNGHRLCLPGTCIERQGGVLYALENFCYVLWERDPHGPRLSFKPLTCYEISTSSAHVNLAAVYVHCQLKDDGFAKASSRV
ncbi:MAG: hypothetical protein ABIL06_19330, partial [Pseudomonadota bacterium]